MNRPKIYALCIVKNEDDIIAQSLEFASRYCDRIYVLDNASTDETWNIVQRLARQDARIVPFGRTDEVFHLGLRARIVNAVHGELSDADWWLILDADEFLAEDPRPIIALATAAGRDCLNTWQIQFAFTERDAEEWTGGRDSRDRPVFERRRYYTIDWQECRLFKNCPRREWDTSLSHNLPQWLGRAYKRRILNRHYQYRDPEQIDKRLRLRLGNQEFTHVRSTDWRSLVQDSTKLSFHRDGDPWRFRFSPVMSFYRHMLSERLGSAVRGGAMRRLRRVIGSSAQPS